MEIVVEFSCDGDLNHKAPIAECVTSEKKSFNIPNEELVAIAFINECTHVYNLKDLVKRFTPENASQIKDKSLSINNLINH